MILHTDLTKLDSTLEFDLFLVDRRFNFSWSPPSEGELLLRFVAVTVNYNHHQLEVYINGT